MATSAFNRRMRRNKQRLRRDGMEAADKGVPTSACPYVADSVNAQHWLTGYALKLADIFNKGD